MSGAVVTSSRRGRITPLSVADFVTTLCCDKVAPRGDSFTNKISGRRLRRRIKSPRGGCGIMRR